MEKDGQAVQNIKPIDKPEWSSLVPVMLDGNRVAMQAKDYSDRFVSGVEYMFEETGGNAKSSEWQKSPYFEVTGLSADRAYSYHYKLRITFRMPGGDATATPRTFETGWSDAVTAKWDASKAFTEQADGPTVIEAEHFSNKTDASDGHRWEFSSAEPPDIWYQSWAGDRSDMKHSGEGYMVGVPKNGVATMGKTTDVKARLDYLVKFTKTGTHYVWVRGGGEHWLDHIVSVGLDLKGADSWGKAIELGWTGIKWVRSKEFKVDSTGVKTINVWMTQDALLVDKIIITTDEKYVPSPANEVDPSSGAPNGMGPARPQGKTGMPAPSRTRPALISAKGLECCAACFDPFCMDSFE